MPIPEISLAQFNKIASGKYNAGFVDFATDAQGNVGLTKVNNHVTRTGLNQDTLSPERILEIKEAFIGALERGRRWTPDRSSRIPTRTKRARSFRSAPRWRSSTPN